MTIGKNIKETRRKLGLTQAELGEKLNVTQQTIAMFENNKTNIKFSTLSKIADALEVDIFTLLGLQNKKLSDIDKLAYNNMELQDSFINYKSESLYNLVYNIVDKSIDEAIESTDLENKLLTAFHKLNEFGKTEAVKRIEELTLINKYI